MVDGATGLTTVAAGCEGVVALELAAAGFSSGIGLGVFLLVPNVIEGRGGVPTTFEGCPIPPAGF